MADTFELTLDDSSPEIAYFPFADTFTTPDQSSGWNPYFTGSGYAQSIGQLGQGDSLHITSLDGASLSIQWNGTGIELYGNTTGQASYNLTLDGKSTQPGSLSPGNDLLASLQNLTDTNHTIALTVTNANSSDTSSFVAFDRARLASRPTNASFTTTVLPDENVAFLGRWSFRKGLNTSASDTQDKTPMHVSSHTGDQARIIFTGAAITLSGVLSPNAGKYSVMLDNKTTEYFARSSFSEPSATLFFATGLDMDSVHTLQVTNEDGGLLGLDVGGINVTGDGSPQPSSPATTTSSATSATYPGGTIAALVLAAVFILLMIGALIYWFSILRPRRRRRREDARRRRAGMQRKDGELDGDKGPSAGDSPRFDVIDITSPDPGATVIMEPDVDLDDLESGTTHEHPRAPYQFGMGLPFEKQSVDFNLDPALYGKRLSESTRGTKVRTRRVRSPLANYTLPSIFRSRSPSRRTNSSSNSNSEPQENVSSHPDSRSRAPAPAGHARDNSRRLLLDGNEADVESPPHSPSLSPATEEAVELYLGPRTSGAVMTAPAGADFASRRASEMRGPRVSFGPRARRSSEDGRRGSMMLNVRPSSPFSVDFLSGKRGSKGSKGTRLSQQVQFDDGTQGDLNADSPPAASAPPRQLAERDMARLADVPRPPMMRQQSAGGQSFLDFSSVASSIRNSTTTSSSSKPSRSSQQPSEQVPHRWSFSAAPGLAVQSPTGTSAGSTPPFPFPVSLPPSPHHPAGTQPHPYAARSSLHLQPPSVAHHDPAQSFPSGISPTDSVPMSVSEIHFRALDAEGDSETQSRRESTGSRLLPHPPLPYTEQDVVLAPHLPTTPLTAASGASPYIVQRTLGLRSPPDTPSVPALSRTASTPASQGRLVGTTVEDVLGPEGMERRATMVMFPTAREPEASEREGERR